MGILNALSQAPTLDDFGRPDLTEIRRRLVAAGLSPPEIQRELERLSDMNGPHDRPGAGPIGSGRPRTP